MNMLIDELPTSVFVDGVSYKINTDYRISIMFEIMMFDPDLTDKQKLEKALILFYTDRVPENIEEAINKIMWFYRCGKEDNDTRKRKITAEHKRVYDYDHDDSYIYAAFLQQYGVDLQDEMLHWWKFKAMFRSLRDDIEFSKIMGYRSIKITSNMTKSQREFYTEMKRIHALPALKSEVDKVKKLEEVLLNGGDVSSLLTGGG